MPLSSSATSISSLPRLRTAYSRYPRKVKWSLAAQRRNSCASATPARVTVGISRLPRSSATSSIFARIPGQSRTMARTSSSTARISSSIAFIAAGDWRSISRCMAAVLGEFARGGLLNLVGGCCGTTPEHIAAIAQAVEGIAPRAVPAMDAVAA